MKKIVFLASGGGGTMKFIHKAISMLSLDYEISAVISDRLCGSIEYSINNNIQTLIFETWSEVDVVRALQQINPDIVITNIYKILSPQLLRCCKAVFVNLHYSLLPSFGGVIGFKTLKMAKALNVKIIGATCHYVSEEVDAGEIISQAAIPVEWEENIDVIGDKVFRIACEIILNAILILSDYKSEKCFYCSQVIYSPPLLYDKSLFDEGFWNSIKES